MQPYLRVFDSLVVLSPSPRRVVPIQPRRFLLGGRGEARSPLSNLFGDGCFLWPCLHVLFCCLFLWHPRSVAA